MSDSARAGIGRNARPALTAAFSQSLSAASNFVILLALGRYAGAHEVGEFALAFIAYNAALGLQRSALTDPLMARPVASSADAVDEDRRSRTISASLALVAALVVAVPGLLTPYHQLLLLAPLLPTLLLEDAARYIAFRHERTAVAALLDGVWCATSLAGVLVLNAHPTNGAALLVWGAGGTAAALVGLALLPGGFAPPFEAIRWWKAELWRSGRWLTLEAGFFHSDQQLTAFGFTAVAGAAAFGEYQVAGSLVGLAMFVTTGVMIVGITHLRKATDDPGRTALLVSGLNFSCVLAVTAVVAVFSRPITHLLYRGRVVVPAGVIVATGAAYALFGVSGGPQLLLRARRTERTMPFARAVAFVIFSPAAVLVAARFGLVAGLWTLVGEGVAYLAIISVAAGRPAPVARTSVCAPVAATAAGGGAPVAAAAAGGGA